ncbi:hypothetical protein DOY81_007390 [Sarcophaga bullata]|nr:hypothetical protein DOY81_007390 [Sarcophaga bullata]
MSPPHEGKSCKSWRVSSEDTSTFTPISLAAYIGCPSLIYYKIINNSIGFVGAVVTMPMMYEDGPPKNIFDCIIFFCYSCGCDECVNRVRRTLWRHSRSRI